MNNNKIIRCKLELRAKELYFERKSMPDIAVILTKESGRKIGYGTVQRYFLNNKQVKQGLVARQEDQKVRTTELILDTVQARHEIINELRALAAQAKNEKDIKTALIGLDKAVNALDSLDKRLGHFMPDTQVNVGVGVGLQVNQAHQDQQFNEFMRVVMEVTDETTRAKIVSRLNGTIDAESKVLS